MRYEQPLKKICPKSLGFDIEDGIIRNISFAGGCPGNTAGLGILAEGRDALEVARTLSGIPCGKKAASCPGELSKAIFKALGKRPPRKKTTALAAAGKAKAPDGAAGA
ncbi:MAG: TSCPD domain-containing protein [Deltaproteobacteria bacterium]|jgi:uncharacterized protein (TIGR03905 family)|nr:TSCPD domain-containing protein [Deltaproteobacteria bacterium]MDR2612157.1 TSCPD domain-containing protein [Deltaproteobacteria bacterium]